MMKVSLLQKGHFSRYGINCFTAIPKVFKIESGKSLANSFGDEEIMILDFYTDNSKRIFYKLASTYQLPTFIKEATISRGEDLQDLPDSTFADSYERLFPCHTKADTAMSYLYFNDQAANMDKKAAERIEKNFKHFFDLFNIDQDEITKIAEVATPDDFDTLANFMLKVDDFGYQFANLKPNERTKLAAELLKYAEDKNFTLTAKHHDFLVKTARAEQAHPSDIAIGILKRATYLKPNDKNCELLYVLANSVEQKKTAKMDEVVEALDDFDLRNKLTRYYGNGLPTPEETCFASSSRMIKEAKEQTIQIGSKFYKKAVLSQIPIDVYSSISTKFAEKISNDGLYVDDSRLAANIKDLTSEQTSQLVSRIKDAGFEEKALLKYDLNKASEFTNKTLESLLSELS
jgi:hypothetical protein